MNECTNSLLLGIHTQSFLMNKKITNISKLSTESTILGYLKNSHIPQANSFLNESIHNHKLTTFS